MYPSRAARALLVPWLSLSLAGCAGWRLETQSVTEVIAVKHPDKIRVQGPRLDPAVLYYPRIEGDSLLGHQRRNSPGPERAVALADVSNVATSHVDAGRTAGLALGVTAAVAPRS